MANQSPFGSTLPNPLVSPREQINFTIEARANSDSGFSIADFLREMGIQSAIQTVLGLIGIAMVNPNSRTFRNLRGPLIALRNGLMALPLDGFTLPQVTAQNTQQSQR